MAALWVVFFHIKGNIASDLPWLDRLIGPIISHGELGVDLFFALSGFVLALNYSERMGSTFSRQRAATFWWARIARVWPVFFLTLLVAGLWHGVLFGSGTDPVEPRDFGVMSFLRQTLLVALWTEPSYDRLMWNGPSWSVSAEAFAYMLFPILILLFFRMGRALASKSLIILAVIAVLPITLFVGAYGHIYMPWSWMLRIVCGFIAGALMWHGVSKLKTSRRMRSWASHLALVAVVLLVAWMYGATAMGRGHLIPMAAPLFVILIGLLAVGDRHIVRLLSTKVFVAGGAASYSVYMVHMLIIEPFWWAQGSIGGIFAPGQVGSKVGFLVLPLVIIGVGYCMWRWFEEPARERIRRMAIANPSGAALIETPVGQAVTGSSPTAEGKL